MSSDDTTIAFPFSRANLPYTITIVVGIVAIAAFLAFDAGSGGTGSAGTAVPDDTTVTTASPRGGLTADDCLSASQALASATAGIGGTALDQAAIDRAFARMAQVGPTAIRADLAVMAAAVDDFFAALDAAGIDLADPNTMASAEARSALADASADFEASGYEDAASRVGDWIEEECAGMTG